MTDSPFRFLDLPIEVRIEIYRYVFAGATLRNISGQMRQPPHVRQTTSVIDYHPGLLRTSRHIYHESLPIWNSNRTLVLLGFSHGTKPNIPEAMMKKIQRLEIFYYRRSISLDNSMPSLKSLTIMARSSADCTKHSQFVTNGKLDLVALGEQYLHCWHHRRNRVSCKCGVFDRLEELRVLMNKERPVDDEAALHSPSEENVSKSLSIPESSCKSEAIELCITDRIDGIFSLY